MFKFPHVVTLEVIARSTTAMGAVEEIWAPVAVDVEAWVQPISAALRDVYSKRECEVTHTVYIKRCDLGWKALDYRVVYKGVAFVLQGVRNQAGLDRVWALDCVEMH